MGANPHEQGLIVALRGRWGQHLIEAEAAGCTQAHHLLNIIFRDTLPILTEGRLIARPVVIETDIHTSGNVSIRIRCFGFGDHLISAIRKTFPEALKKASGSVAFVLAPSSKTRRVPVLKASRNQHEAHPLNSLACISDHRV